MKGRRIIQGNHREGSQPLLLQARDDCNIMEGLRGGRVGGGRVGGLGGANENGRSGTAGQAG